MFQGAEAVFILVVLAAAFALVASFLRLPLLVGYILAGAVIGSGALIAVEPASRTALQAMGFEIGVSFLVFFLGLELSVRKVLQVKRVVIGGSLLVCATLALIGFVTTTVILDRSPVEGLYLGAFLAFSSATLILPALGTRKTASLHGRLLMGWLAFEDILAIAVISLLALFTTATPSTPFADLLTRLGFDALRGWSFTIGLLVILTLTWLLIRFVARPLFRFFATNAELLLIASLGTFFAFASLANAFGFSTPIGAFLAGAVIANSGQYLPVLDRLRTVARFFGLLFFAALGLSFAFDQGSLTTVFLPAASLALLVVLLKPFLATAVARLLGYDERTGLTVGLHLGSLSEMGLVIIAIGVAQGAVSPELFSIAATAALMAFLISSVVIRFGDRVVARIDRALPRFVVDEAFADPTRIDHAGVVVFGIDHVPFETLRELEKRHPPLIVIDPDPDDIDSLRAAGIPCMRGSLASPYVLERLGFDRARLVLSTSLDVAANLAILARVRAVRPRTHVMLYATTPSDALMLYRAGADAVLVASPADDPALSRFLLGEDTDLVATGRHERSRLRGSRKTGTDLAGLVTKVGGRVGRVTGGRR